MNNNELIQNLKSMTVEERIAFLKANRPDVFQPTMISFGKAPKDGWKESDKVAK